MTMNKISPSLVFALGTLFGGIFVGCMNERAIAQETEEVSAPSEDEVAPCAPCPPCEKVESQSQEDVDRALEAIRKLELFEQHEDLNEDQTTVSSSQAE